MNESQKGWIEDATPFKGDATSTETAIKNRRADKVRPEANREWAQGNAAGGVSVQAGTCRSMSGSML